jgi:hypothetical protein
MKQKYASIFQNPFTFSLDILELTPVYGPPKATQYEKYQHHRQRNQQIKNLHQRPDSIEMFRAKRSAFKTTKRELVAMPSPAAQAGSQPTTANGMQAAL